MWRWSVEAAKSESNKAKKYFQMEFVDKEQEDTCKDLDFGALETDLQANRKLLGCLQLQLPDAASERLTVAVLLKTIPFGPLPPLFMSSLLPASGIDDNCRISRGLGPLLLCPLSFTLFVNQINF
ncbi:hypothetical protein J1N35_031377 [Gossypium stocksii]|uniref:Uncharacterized protein n=1 Tax=Gossypium stocksii TaxID=47602 RepID=A0A9D3V110_9ROSI|nr:hypothetical protein J1N35_031377 [Gossypium stocksii]